LGNSKGSGTQDQKYAKEWKEAKMSYQRIEIYKHDGDMGN